MLLKAKLVLTSTSSRMYSFKALVSPWPLILLDPMVYVRSRP